MATRRKKKVENESVMDQVRNLGDRVLEAGRTTYLAGLGVLAVAEEEAGEVFDRCLDRGRRFDEDERNALRQTTDDVKRLGDKAEHAVRRAVTTTLGRAGVPSHEEIHTLTRRVETLTEKVEQLGVTR